MKTNFPCILFSESPDVWENIRKLAAEQRKKQECQNPPKKRDSMVEQEKWQEGRKANQRYKHSHFS